MKGLESYNKCEKHPSRSATFSKVAKVHKYKFQTPF